MIHEKISNDIRLAILNNDKEFLKNVINFLFTENTDCLTDKDIFFLLSYSDFKRL